MASLVPEKLKTPRKSLPTLPMSVPRPRSPRRVKPRRYFAAAIATGHSALCKTLFNGSFLTRIPLCGSFSRFFSPKSLFKFLLSELFCLTKKTVNKRDCELLNFVLQSHPYRHYRSPNHLSLPNTHKISDSDAEDFCLFL